MHLSGFLALLNIGFFSRWVVSSQYEEVHRCRYRVCSSTPAECSVQSRGNRLIAMATVVNCGQPLPLNGRYLPALSCSSTCPACPALLFAMFADVMLWVTVLKQRVRWRLTRWYLGIVYHVSLLPDAAALWLRTTPVSLSCSRLATQQETRLFWFLVAIDNKGQAPETRLFMD
jgi:hypothetical protein